VGNPAGSSREELARWGAMKKDFVLLFLSVVCAGFLNSCGQSYPFEDTSSDSEAQIDYLEGKLEAEQYPTYDPAIKYQDQLDEDSASNIEDYYVEPTDIELDSENGNCQTGCTFHFSGCDIKGNVSVDTGNKIYHIPGQKWYEQTKIDPNYGEKWFCTEEDAQAAGWRKSYE
jgi:hypothetical protein